MEAQEGLEEEEVPEELKRTRRPEEPTQREFEEHMALHMPFRAWCPHCVKGRAKSEPHRVAKDREEGTARKDKGQCKARHGLAKQGTVTRGR